MSTSLYWRPTSTYERFIGKQIKYLIAPELWDHDGTLCSDWTIIDSSFVPYLKGVMRAGDKEVRGEAEKIIKLIEKHGQIEIALIT